ncbi:GNAT family N-acetyltransferase [Candidatus Dependentiae bacterium]|nr:GNAT family N-acetyltransferase [Candidatus Dependentiae bacterium]
MNKLLLFSILLFSSYTFSMENEKSVEIITLNPALWEEYKNLRLYALTDEPLAFGMSEKDDMIKPNDHWYHLLYAAQQEKDVWKLFAQIDGQLVGTVGAVRMWHDQEYMKHIVTIVGLYVLPEFRKKGIGTLLMKKLIDKLKKDSTIGQVILLVTETQKTAINLYEKIGFNVTGIIPRGIKFDEQYYDTFMMRLFGKVS